MFFRLIKPIFHFLLQSLVPDVKEQLPAPQAKRQTQMVSLGRSSLLKTFKYESPCAHPFKMHYMLNNA